MRGHPLDIVSTNKPTPTFLTSNHSQHNTTQHKTKQNNITQAQNDITHSTTRPSRHLVFPLDRSPITNETELTSACSYQRNGGAASAKGVTHRANRQARVPYNRHDTEISTTCNADFLMALDTRRFFFLPDPTTSFRSRASALGIYRHRPARFPTPISG